MNHDFNNVPDSIRRLNQWILWKVHTRDGRATKVPCNIHGTPCNAQDFQNHISFQEAIDTILNSPAGRFNGIGFVFKEGGGLTGIDLDKCVDPDTGAIEPWAEDIINSMDSYTEFSVSGTGFHIIVKGTLPGIQNRKGKIEMYDSKRFFVMTGDVVGEPSEVMERQKELTDLYNQVFPEPAKPAPTAKSPVVKRCEERLNRLSDEMILEKLFQETQGGKWRMLYEQGWHEANNLDYKSQSDADFGFLAKLAFYSSDAEQIERIMSNSALGQRDKWMNREDYRERQITKILARGGAKYAGRTKRIENDESAPTKPSSDIGEGEEYPDIAPFETYAIPTFPVDIFPRWLHDYVRAVAAFVQAPVDLVAIMALIALATTVQRRFELEITPGYVEPLSLYAIGALPSGNRKSDVYKKMIKPLEDYEKQLKEEITDAISERKVDIEILKSQHANLLKEIKKGNLDARLQLAETQKLIDKTKELFPPSLIKQDITAEKLIQAMSENHNRMGVLNAEGGLLDIISGIYSGKKSNVDIFLKGHSGESYSYDRKNGGSIYLESPALSVGLLVQNEHLQSVLSNKTLSGRGLFARFLYTLPVPLGGNRDPEGVSIPPVTQEEYHAMMTNMLKRKPPSSKDTKDSQPNLVDYIKNEIQGNSYTEEEQTQTIRLSQAAYEVYKRLFKKNEPRLRADNPDLTSDLKAWAGKLVGQIMRIAGLLHMAEHANTPELPEEVTASTVEAAIRLEEYFLEHALRAFGEASEGKQAEKQKYLLQALVKAQGDNTLIEWCTPTKIWNMLKRKGYAKVTDMDTDLKELVDRGYLLVEHVKRKGKGRDSTKYGLNPKAIKLLNR